MNGEAKLRVDVLQSILELFSNGGDFSFVAKFERHVKNNFAGGGKFINNTQSIKGVDTLIFGNKSVDSV